MQDTKRFYPEKDSLSRGEDLGVSVGVVSGVPVRVAGRTKKGVEKGAFGPSFLDTLAQPRNTPQKHTKNGVSEDPSVIQARHVKRAQSKAIFRPLLTVLCELRSPLEKPYRSSYYCCETFVQLDDVLTSRYCKQRWCPICNRIRTAIMLNHYGPVLEAWPEPYFVTLTRQTVPVELLGDTYVKSLSKFNAVKDSMRKSRTAPLKLVALRKTECTFNVTDDRYHLHYHVITATANMAYRLRDGWLSRHPVELANPRAQDVRRVDDRSLKELFKYATKLVTKGRDARRQYVPPGALDNIFQALRGKRLLQPIGFKVPTPVLEAETDFDTTGGIPALTRLGEKILWDWVQDATDWVDFTTGEVLSGYTPTDDERRLMGLMMSDN